MAYTPADLETAARHIAKGERHVAQQERLITRLRLAGAPTDEAEHLLDWLNDTLQRHRVLHAQIKADLDTQAGGATRNT
jgi:hypothetical protein